MLHFKVDTKLLPFVFGAGRRPRRVRRVFSCILRSLLDRFHSLYHVTGSLYQGVSSIWVERFTQAELGIAAAASERIAGPLDPREIWEPAVRAPRVGLSTTNAGEARN